MKTLMVRTAKLLAALASCFLLLGYFVSGAFLKKHYLDPWKEGYASGFEDPRLRVVAGGLLAPSLHNLQPWSVRLEGETGKSFLLYVDVSRLAPEVDPLARQATVSQGTFLEMARVAAEGLGYSMRLDLFPEGEYDLDGTPESIAAKPVCRVTLVKRGPEGNGGGGTAFPLADKGIRTKGAEINGSSGEGLVHQPVDLVCGASVNRLSYRPEGLTEVEVVALQGLEHDPELKVTILQGEEDLVFIGSMAERAAKVEVSRPECLRADRLLFRSNEFQKNRHRDGYTLEGQGMGRGMVFLVQATLSLFPFLGGERSVRDGFLRQVRTAVRNTPVYLIISSRESSRTAQVKAGMLYARLQLAAAAMGYSLQPLSQALEEYPEMEDIREELHGSYAGEGEVIQMLARMGRPVGETGLGPRREATDLLLKGD